jgi:Retinal pigment epithelial membrane protein
VAVCVHGCMHCCTACQLFLSCDAQRNMCSQVRIADLETLQRLKFKDDVKGLLTTAHPAILPDGSIVNFCSDVSIPPAVWMYQLTQTWGEEP